MIQQSNSEAYIQKKLIGAHASFHTHALERYVHPNVHGSTVYNSQDVEATYVTINR